MGMHNMIYHFTHCTCTQSNNIIAIRSVLHMQTKQKLYLEVVAKVLV